MGDEARCVCRYDGKESEGRAHLERDRLVFRGDFRVVVSLSRVTRAMARDGVLELTHPDGAIAFELGDAASKWAEVIAHPKSLVDRLGVKDSSRVLIIGIEDEELIGQLSERAAMVTKRRGRTPVDLVFLGARARAALTRLTALTEAIERNGAIWVVRPKGVKEITEQDVLTKGRKAGLVDTKVVSISSTHTGEKFVIPRSKR